MTVTGKISLSVIGLIILGLGVSNAVQRSMSEEVTTKVSYLYDRAIPQVIESLPNDATLSQQQLESVINAAVKKAIESDTKEKNSGLTFEVLTCKLTVDWSYTGSWGKLTAGEVSVCKVSAALAAAIIACKKLPEFKACAMTELKRAKSAATKVIEAEKKEARRSVDESATEAEADMLERAAHGDEKAIREIRSRGAAGEERGFK